MSRTTIIRADSIVLVDGRPFTVDLSDMPAFIHAVQWDGTKGHIEFTDQPNEAIVSIGFCQTWLDRWEAARQTADAPPPPKTVPELIAGRRVAINSECEKAIAAIRAGYPDSEVLSWPKQEAEARAFAADPSAATPLLDALALARGIAKAALAARVIAKADAFAALSGALIGKRQALEDRLDALPADAMPEQIAAVVWP